MKILKGLLLAAIVMLTQNALAQSYAETALLFSRTKPAGSARMLGMGGAQISLGGDFSSALSNPAGLGMFNRSEFSFSPGYNTVRTSGDYFTGESDPTSVDNADVRSILSVPALSFAFSKEKNGDAGFIHGTFGITMQRTNDFNTNFQYSGRNVNSSLIDYFVDQATGLTPEQFESGGESYNTVTELAYVNYLIGERTIQDPNNDPTTYFTDVQTIPFQSESVTTKGAQNQWNFSYGANFNDVFFLGAGVGIASVNYQTKKVYAESFVDPYLRDFDLTESLQIKGSGINFTMGAIGRPVEGLQLGASFTTPTRYNITENWNASLASSWKNFEYLPDLFLNEENGRTDMLTTNYTLTTPSKLSAGASYFFGKHGLITADIERLNYGSTKYNSTTSGVSFTGDNADIKELYRAVTNIRVGGEFRLESWRFRAGYNLMPDPYITVQNEVKRSISSVSAGLGFRKSKYFIDLAYIYSLGKNTYRPYTINNVASPLYQYQQTSGNLVSTVGFTF